MTLFTASPNAVYDIGPKTRNVKSFSLRKHLFCAQTVINTYNNKIKKRNLLKVSVAKSMIQKFLVEDKAPKEKLANALGITTKQLNCFSKNGSLKTLIKINLPLIKLYCKTKWSKKTNC